MRLDCKLERAFGGDRQMILKAPVGIGCERAAALGRRVRSQAH
jgi:hypothetical protein